jgi:hypothetical protein
MNKKLFCNVILAVGLSLISTSICSKEEGKVTKFSYPKTIYTGPWKSGHVQGIAVDKKGGYIYYSFTTMLVKTDMKGKLIGTVTGFLGHLGCLTFNESDRHVYGSLEYKNDEIGKGILNLEHSSDHFPDAWYIAIFDGSKIDKENIKYTDGNVMKAVYLPTVVSDYSTKPNKYGCVGLDGVTFGPAFGKKEGKLYLTCAYGIKGDTKRKDNDYNVLLQYDITRWKDYAKPLTQEKLHQSGPIQPEGKYFVYTGNTSYGVQNLSYDRFTKNWFMFVYRGNKTTFLNNSLYIIDGSVAPVLQPLKGSPDGEKGFVLSLVKDGLYDDVNGVYGWESFYGTTGFAPLGKGYYYIAHNRQIEGGQTATIHLYQWTGDIPTPFKMVK